jgi:hypothetical protein
MRPWQKNALKIVAEARGHASRTSDTRLHLACSRTIEAMAREGCQIPSDLRTYARQIRELYEVPLDL